MNKLARLLYCFLGGVVLVAAASTQPTLLIGECVVNVPTSSETVGMNSFAVRCQLAAFGAYLSEEGNDLKLVLAPGDDMLACSTLGDSQAHSNFGGAAVIVRRGKCSFQEKLALVAAAGAAAMVLVNSEEALIPLSSLEYEHSTAAAVSVTKGDGERLIKIIQDAMQQAGAASGAELRMIAPVDPIRQARTRLQFLADINTPVAMYEEYWGITEQLQPLVGTLDELLAKILSEDDESGEMFQDEAKAKDFIEFFSWRVFLDELGSFSESLRFFGYAANLCDSDRTTLELRQALAVPIIFSSRFEMDKFVEDLRSKLQILTEATAKKKMIEERVISPLGDADKPVEVPSDQATLALRPEAAAYLQYTITPPTMFIGYQGINILPIQRAINQLRSSLYPSLSSSFDRLDGSTNHNLRRIGFISTWFRVHSVGKLLLGVVQNLDRTKFHVSIYRCVHFLTDSDDITDAFKREADEYRELSESQDAAVKFLRQAQLDIAIFPELGMDEWTVLLSHHRVAPIQCVFWGHPITTGNPNIDYFISSEHFTSGEFENALELPDVSDVQLKLSGYRRSFFSEKIVLFRGLSTLFTEPKPLTAASKGINRSRLFLPANRRLYVCSQTLMKFHPAFDEALTGILDQDDKATIVLLASDTQIVWMEQLRRRFRQRFGRNHWRVLFLPTLPFPEFQALLTQADVLLDPFPFGGGVTTLDALHLGIPVVTLPSAQSVVHLAAGFLRYMNASDCIANSLDEYVELAIGIAKDHADIRQRLLAHQSDIYQDVSTVDDWNTFLNTVTPREQDMK
ncbi:hypothetical protein PR001_g10469 [Phytophthora rubi]|uniref:O-GlcNAc transferase C-terminal domain-containing protein n=1 Tax=Phytophthora rubi TaxID=129364 RepID=A0A6A3MMU2_9STRA|nr:hypothetical protein PR001_g10469 [Phytophthora rubi]